MMVSSGTREPFSEARLCVSGLEVDWNNQVSMQGQRQRGQGLSQRKRGAPDVDLIALAAADGPIGNCNFSPASMSCKISLCRLARRFVTMSTMITLIPWNR